MNSILKIIKDSPLLVGLTSLYVTCAVFLSQIFDIQIFGDTESYLEAAAIPFSDTNALITHWRFNTIVLWLKFFGENFSAIANFQLIVYLITWILFAATVKSLIKQAWLGRFAFAAVLLFSLSAELFMWNRLILTESIDIALILVFIILALKFQTTVLNDTSPSRSQQLVWGGMFAIVIVLWGYSRPPNYWNALVICGFVVLSTLIWHKTTRRWPLALGIITVSLLGVYQTRNYLVNNGDAWPNAFMNSIAYNIMMDDEKLDFFVERGMPANEEALAFKGYVPARYAGDIEVVFGDWLDTTARQTYIEYMIFNAPQLVWESLLRWDDLSDPPTSDLNVRRDGFPLYYSDFQIRHAHALLNPSGLAYILLLVIALAIAIPQIAQRQLDSRWLIPLILILSTIPLSLLNLNSDFFEARHHVANAMKYRLAALMILFFVLDRWLADRQTMSRNIQRYGSVLVGLVVLLSMFELMSAYQLTRDKLVYPIATQISPDRNLLQHWDVDDASYSVYQHVSQDETILKLQSDTVVELNEIYRREFIINWGLTGIFPQVHVTDEDLVAYSWRNSPAPITVVGPQGPVYGPVEQDWVTAPDYRAWQERRLPGTLAPLDIHYVWVDQLTWEIMPSFERGVFTNEQHYRQIADLRDGFLFEAIGNQAVWASAADGDNQYGMSDETLAAYETFVAELDEALVFSPTDSGTLARNSTQTDLVGVLQSAVLTPAEQTPYFALIYWLENAQLSEDLSEQSEAIGIWRGQKTAQNLSEADIDYLFAPDDWFGWLTAEELARFDDEDGYRLVQRWQLPFPFRLYEVTP